MEEISILQPKHEEKSKENKNTDHTNVEEESTSKRLDLNRYNSLTAAQRGLVVHNVMGYLIGLDKITKVCALHLSCLNISFLSK